MLRPIINSTVTAYDKNHNRLLLDTTTATNVDGDMHPKTYDKVLTIYATRRTANVPDTNTGAWTRRTRRIAYFRTSESGNCYEIHFTQYGRQAGVRNYQARRPGDNPCTEISGTPPIHTAPRIERHSIYRNPVLVVGEGDPYCIDLSADTATIIAEAFRYTRRECGWSGYLISEIHGDDRKLPDATLHTVHLAFKEAELRYNNR